MTTTIRSNLITPSWNTTVCTLTQRPLDVLPGARLPKYLLGLLAEQLRDLWQLWIQRAWLSSEARRSRWPLSVRPETKSTQGSVFIQLQKTGGIKSVVQKKSRIFKNMTNDLLNTAACIYIPACSRWCTPHLSPPTLPKDQVQWLKKKNKKKRPTIYLRTEDQVCGFWRWPCVEGKHEKEFKTK